MFEYVGVIMTLPKFFNVSEEERRKTNDIAFRFLACEFSKHGGMGNFATGEAETQKRTTLFTKELCSLQVESLRGKEEIFATLLLSHITNTETLIKTNEMDIVLGCALDIWVAYAYRPAYNHVCDVVNLSKVHEGDAMYFLSISFMLLAQMAGAHCRKEKKEILTVSSKGPLFVTVKEIMDL